MRLRPKLTKLSSFHSIDFPSEWGLQEKSRPRKGGASLVSIQLISPASGDHLEETKEMIDAEISGFHSIDFPSEWGRNPLLGIYAYR